MFTSNFSQQILPHFSLNVYNSSIFGFVGNFPSPGCTPQRVRQQRLRVRRWSFLWGPDRYGRRKRLVASEFPVPLLSDETCLETGKSLGFVSSRHVSRFIILTPTENCLAVSGMRATKFGLKLLTVWIAKIRRSLFKACVNAHFLNFDRLIFYHANRNQFWSTLIKVYFECSEVLEFKPVRKTNCFFVEKIWFCKSN